MDTPIGKKHGVCEDESVAETALHEPASKRTRKKEDEEGGGEEEEEEEEEECKGQKSVVLSSDPAANHQWFWREFVESQNRRNERPSIRYKDLVGGLHLQKSFSAALSDDRHTKLLSAELFMGGLAGQLQQHLRDVVVPTGRFSNQRLFVLDYFQLKSGSIRCVSYGFLNRTSGQDMKLCEPFAATGCTLMTDDAHYAETLEIAEEFIQTGTRLVFVGNIGSANERKCEITAYRGVGNVTVHELKPLDAPDYAPPIITLSQGDVGFCASGSNVNTNASKTFTLDLMPLARGYFQRVQGEAWHVIGTGYQVYLPEKL